MWEAETLDVLILGTLVLAWEGKDKRGLQHTMEAKSKGLGLGWGMQRGWGQGCPQETSLRTMIARVS